MGIVTAKGEAGANGEDSRGAGSKRRPLVEDVLEYWESYEGVGANYVWHLQHP